MDAHVNEQLVTGVEWPMATRATGPETGEILCPTLVDVTAFNMLDEILLAVKRSFTIDPTAVQNFIFIIFVLVDFIFDLLLCWKLLLLSGEPMSIWRELEGLFVTVLRRGG